MSPDLITLAVVRSDRSMKELLLRETERKSTSPYPKAEDKEKEGKILEKEENDDNNNDDMNVILKRSLRYMNPVYYFFYGVWYDMKMIGLDTDREEAVNYWIPRFWCFYSLLVVVLFFHGAIRDSVTGSDGLDFRGFMIELLYYSSFFGLHFIAGCQQAYFGGHIAKSRCLERVVERLKRDLRDNVMKQRILVRLGLIHVVTTLILCLAAFLSFLSAILGGHMSIVAFFFAVLPALGPGIHLSLIWVWILWTRQICIRTQIDEMEKDLRADKRLDLDTVKKLFDEYLNDAKELSNEWAVGHMIRIFSAFGEFMAVSSQLMYNESSQANFTQIIEEGNFSLYFNFCLYFGFVWLSVIVAGYMNAAFYEDCVLSLLLNKNFDDNSSVVLPYLRRIMIGSEAKGYKILGRFINSAHAIFVGTGAIALYKIATSLNGAR